MVSPELDTTDSEPAPADVATDTNIATAPRRLSIGRWFLRLMLLVISSACAAGALLNPGATTNSSTTIDPASALVVTIQSSGDYGVAHVTLGDANSSGLSQAAGACPRPAAVRP